MFVYCLFIRTHSFNVMVELLQNIHSEFYLNSQKIITIITDDAINFSKMFILFTLNSKSMNKMLGILVKKMKNKKQKN